MGNRQLKKEVLDLLAREDFSNTLHRFAELPGRRVVNPLFSFLYSTDENIRWHAVSAMGVTTAKLASTDAASARVVMRRLIWNLNDESGGIGWGSPEAMGEIMARSRMLAREFSKILVSYIFPRGNFLEHEVLQRGLLWGLHRLSQTNPELTLAAAPCVRSFLTSRDPIHRGLAACFAGAVGDGGAMSDLETLGRDRTTIPLYMDLKIASYSLSDLAAAAISDIKRHPVRIDGHH